MNKPNLGRRDVQLKSRITRQKMQIAKLEKQIEERYLIIDAMAQELAEINNNNTNTKEN